MAKIIALFNHKGGVSKPTTAFNLGWMLGKLGKKVILADFDPQCNLTGMVLDYQGVDQLSEFYKSDPPNNVKDVLAPAFEAQVKPIDGADCVEVPGNNNLLLLPGHIDLSDYETTLGIAQQLGGSLLPLKNLPGSLRVALDKTAEAYGADYVLLDMSPSVGPVNQNLLMTSDHFIIPLFPDFFSSMALSSLTKVLPRWKKWAESAYGIELLKESLYPFPKPDPLFIGAVVQNYRPRKGIPSAAFREWVSQLKKTLKEDLIPGLEEANLLSAPRFKAVTGKEPWDFILSVPDFNSLIALSQKHRVPAYALTKNVTGQTGAVWQRTEKTIKSLEHEFASCAEKVVNLAG